MLNNETMYKLIVLLDDTFDKVATDSEILERIKEIAEETAKQRIDIEESGIEVPTVIIEVPLYDYDNNDNVVPFDEETANQALEEICSRDDICGYSIWDINLETRSYEF